MKKLVFTTLLASILAFSTNAKEIILEDMGKVKVNLTVSIPFSNFDGCNGRFYNICLLYTSPSPRDATLSRMPSSA